MFLTILKLFGDSAAPPSLILSKSIQGREAENADVNLLTLRFLIDLPFNEIGNTDLVMADFIAERVSDMEMRTQSNSDDHTVITANIEYTGENDLVKYILDSPEAIELLLMDNGQKPIEYEDDKVYQDITPAAQ